MGNKLFGPKVICMPEKRENEGQCYSNIENKKHSLVYQ
jgi:hypothetical protein